MMRAVTSWCVGATAVGAVALAGGLAAAAGSNLVRNGSFERPVVAEGGYQTFGQGSSFQGWRVVGDPGHVAVVSGTLTANGFTLPARSRAQWLDLTGAASNSATGVEQSVVTTPGSAYTLTFYVGNVFDTDGPLGTTSTVDVLVDGALLMTASHDGGEGTDTVSWRRFQKTFSVEGPRVSITFINRDPVDDGMNGLDGVKLEEVAAEVDPS